MLIFLIRRLLQSVLVLLVMSVLVFAGVYAIGNPVDILISPDANQAERARIIAAFGLDQPLWRQYLLFLQNAAAGNLGRSFAFSTPALALILERFPATMELAVSAMLLSVGLGIPLGLLAGLKPGSLAGKAIMTISVLGFSLPTFWVGLMLIMVFAVKLGWLPSSDRGETVDVFGVPLSFLTWDGLQHLLLPALNLALFNIALVIRLTRAGAQEALQQDYVRFARAKGLSNGRIIGVHVLKNILIPIVTVLALQFGSLIAFAIVTETVFAWPGMGKLIIDSIRVLDRPVIVAYLMLIVTLFIVINLVVDVLYSLLDPRVRLGGCAMMTRMVRQPETPLMRFARAYFASRIAAAASAVLLLMILAALCAPLLAPQNPYDLMTLDIMDSRLAPGTRSGDYRMHYLMGTDEQGRDMLSAILYGLRISIAVGFASTAVALAIGLALGLLAGYAGARVDSLIMRVADIQLSFPPILIALVLLAVSGPGVGKIIIALIAVQWAYYARTARSAALVERGKEYMEAAHGLGLSPARIVLRHLLPNCLPPLIVIAALQVASAISLEATLSFLGLGLPVTEPSLGLLISNGFQYLLSGTYWISFYPGLALLLTVAAINLVADQLRDVLNPRLQEYDDG